LEYAASLMNKPTVSLRGLTEPLVAPRKREENDGSREEGIKRPTVFDARGTPLGSVVDPANRHDSPLLDATLDAL
jgi:hypothetical protein